MTTNVEMYWEQYLASLPVTAQSGGLVWSGEADREPGPRPGDLWIVIAEPDEPVCVIETIEVRTFLYDEVPEEYAWEGGEGDRTVADWRRMYWEYIVFECKRIGREPNTKAPLAMERFRVVYFEPLRAI